MPPPDLAAAGRDRSETGRTPWSAAGWNKPAVFERRKPSKSGGTTRTERTGRWQFLVEGSETRSFRAKRITTGSGRSKHMSTKGQSLDNPKRGVRAGSSRRDLASSQGTERIRQGQHDV